MTEISVSILEANLLNLRIAQFLSKQMERIATFAVHISRNSRITKSYK